MSDVKIVVETAQEDPSVTEQRQVFAALIVWMVISFVLRIILLKCIWNNLIAVAHPEFAVSAAEPAGVLLLCFFFTTSKDDHVASWKTFSKVMSRDAVNIAFTGIALVALLLVF